jgi:exodeoxyribonuclease V alpha subunit
MTEQQTEHDADQERAIDLICSDEPIGIITGGPGTGKTTTLKKALRDVRLMSKNVVLVAPTGKAAKRMTEVVGMDASTIHRLTGFNGEQYGTDQLPHDLYIADEASMVDAQMLYHLLVVMKKGARLRLIGDADQLPSVGAGSVLRDLLDTNSVPVVRLKTLHRSAAESWICSNAPKILAGEMFDTTKRDDFEAFEMDSSYDVIDLAKQLMVHHKINFFLGRFQLLTPMNVGDLGTEVLNHEIASELNPNRLEGDHIELAVPRASMQQFAGVGDKVIHVQNNYILNVFNGELGVIDRIAEGKVFVKYPGRFVEYPQLVAMHQLRLAYALTVHKAQGSEWESIGVICHGMHIRMWSRQLLYTAVTRAKRGVTLIGNEEGIGIALAQNKPRERFTTLPNRIVDMKKEAGRRVGT